MRAVIQRVCQASVTIAGDEVAKIGPGLLVLFAVHTTDIDSAVGYLADKILNLRIFSDSEGKMNLSLLDTAGEILVVSQFTLYGDARKGRRPSFIDSAKPEVAIPLYERFVETLRASGLTVATGKFGADMKVSLTNDGPVTILLDSPA